MPRIRVIWPNLTADGKVYGLGQIEENPGPQLLEIATNGVMRDGQELAYFFEPADDSEFDITNPPVSSEEYRNYWIEKPAPDGSKEYHCTHCNRVFANAAAIWGHLDAVFYPSKGAKGRSRKPKGNRKSKKVEYSEEEMQAVYDEIFGG